MLNQITNCSTLHFHFLCRLRPSSATPLSPSRASKLLWIMTTTSCASKTRWEGAPTTLPCLSSLHLLLLSRMAGRSLLERPSHWGGNGQCSIWRCRANCSKLHTRFSFFLLQHCQLVIFCIHAILGFRVLRKAHVLICTQLRSCLEACASPQSSRKPQKREGLHWYKNTPVCYTIHPSTTARKSKKVHFQIAEVPSRKRSFVGRQLSKSNTPFQTMKPLQQYGWS